MVVSRGGGGGGLGDEARGRLDPAPVEHECQGEELGLYSGAVGSHSVLLSGRVTWAEMHFGGHRLMAELRSLPGPCHSLPSTCIFIYCVSFSLSSLAISGSKNIVKNNII